jgi:hypothetical protein
MASPALAGEVVRHTGAIVSENTKAGTLTIEEMGPWHGPGMRPVQREFRLTPRITVELALRKDEPGGFNGEFIERPLGVMDVRPGDYATVTVEREAGKTVATKVVVVRPSSSAGVSRQAPAGAHALKTAARAAR